MAINDIERSNFTTAKVESISKYLPEIPNLISSTVWPLPGDQDLMMRILSSYILPHKIEGSPTKLDTVLEPGF